MSNFSLSRMTDAKWVRRWLVNDVLPRRLKLAIVTSGIILYPRYKRYALEFARVNSDVDYDRVKALLDKKEFGAAWSEIYAPAVGARVETLSELEYHCYIEYSLNHILHADKIGSQKNYRALGLDFPHLPTIAFIRKGRLYASDGVTEVPPRADYLKILSIDPDREYLAKPAGLDSGSGRAVAIMTGRDMPNRLKDLANQSNLYIVQEVFRGHDFFRGLNSTSLNTIRFMTLKVDNRPRLLSAVLRVGRPGRVTDNVSSGGGVFIGVDEHGRLRDRALDSEFRAHGKLPDSGLAFAGLQIPHYQKMVDMCLEAHRGLRNLGVLSWDVALSEKNEPVVVEVNCAYQGIGIHQAVNPGSLLPLMPYRVSWWERMRRVWDPYPTDSDLRESPGA